MHTRMKLLTTLLGGAAFLAALAMPSAQAQATDQAASRSNRIKIGPQVGVFLPTDSKTRDRFGNAWFSLGIGFGDIEPATSKGSLTFDAQLYANKRGDNYAYVLPVGIGYRIGLGGQDSSSVPYAGVSADVDLAYLRSLQDGVTSGLRTGVGGSGFVGVDFGKNGYVEARYQATSRIKSFNFSGFSVSAGYLF